MSTNGAHSIGQRFTKDDGVQIVSGSASYVDDLRPAGVLYGAVLRAGRPHARIRRLDTRRAERAPGVHCVITAKDITSNAYGPCLQDQPVLCSDKVRYEGDPVAAVCAESWQAAAEAARLIEVDYEDLPPVSDPEEALRPGAPPLHEAHPTGNLVLDWKVRHGDVEAGFAEADLIVEERYRSSRQEHAPIEPHICMAEVTPSGRINLYVSSQTPYIMRFNVGKVLNIPLSKVRVIGCKVGGAFGGKHEIMLEPLAALGALKTGRPVKFRMTREEEFTASTIRHAMIMDYKTGVTRDGRITARQISLILDTGAYLSFGETTASKAALMGAGPYRIGNLSVDAKLAYTNNGVAGALRGFGVTQTTFACEAHMDSIARRLGMDPLELRRINAMKIGDTAHSGDVIRSCGFAETLDTATRTINWSAIGRGARANGGTRRRGRGLAAMIYPIGFTATNNPSGAFARVNEDATLTVWTGCADVGQGAHVALKQIAAEELCIPFGHVHLISRDTDVAPMDLGSVASRVTHIGGNAVRRAVRKVKEQILRKAAELIEASVDDLRIGDGMVYVEGAPERCLPLAEIALKCHRSGELIVAEGVYNPPDLHLDKSTGQGKPYDCYVFATHAAEVEVDVETGECRVLHLVASHDVGKAVNPLNVECQIEGGSLQGLGFGMMEHIQIRDGIVMNPNFDDYLIPTALDAPDRTTPIIVESEEPSGPFGAKGVAEPALNPTTPAILNAIRDAVGAPITELPATPEAILRAIRSHKNGNHSS